MGKQKRSENTYQKINTIFKRDINNIIMPYDGLAVPELEWLRPLKFLASEKVDGTNIRIEIKPYLSEVNGRVSLYIPIEIKGKTDNAQIPKLLEEYMHKTFISSDGKSYDGICDNFIKVIKAFGYEKSVYTTRDSVEGQRWVDCPEVIEKMLADGYIHKIGSHTINIGTDHEKEIIDYGITKQPPHFTIYGEGYGKGIQKAGPHYIKDGVSFRGFDVKYTDPNTKTSMYLNNDKRDAIFDEIGIEKVPDMGEMTIDEAIEFVKKGFISNISEDREFLAEGLVLKTPDGLLTRRGERIIFKVKHGDFVKYFNKYGTYDKVDQIVNPNY